MRFYSGFSLHQEHTIFEPFLEEGDFTLSGFSLGAILAFEEACTSRDRIDKLQLFSPAFFEDKDAKFKRMQGFYFKKDKEAYVKNFLKNIAYPSSLDMQAYYHDSTPEALEKLLYFTWSQEQLQILREKGIMIEVYLGMEDKIIDVQAVRDFFLPFASVIMIKNSGHILKERDG